MLISLLAVLVCGLVLYYLFNGAVPVPTDSRAVLNMLELVPRPQGMKMADLGSGDGRIVLAFAKAGADSVGFEINPVMIWWSRFKLRRAGFPNARIEAHSFWSADLGQFDVVTVFGMSHIMGRIQKKILADCRPGTFILCNVFELPGLKPIAHAGSVFLYKI